VTDETTQPTRQTQQTLANEAAGEVLDLRQYRSMDELPQVIQEQIREMEINHRLVLRRMVGEVAETLQQKMEEFMSKIEKKVEEAIGQRQEQPPHVSIHIENVFNGSD